MHSNLHVRPPPISDQVSKTPNFPSQIPTNQTSCKLPPLMSHHDHIFSIVFILLQVSTRCILWTLFAVCAMPLRVLQELFVKTWNHSYA